MKSIALLPHPDHLLPEGRLEIVVSSVCDIRMVKEAITKDGHFAIAMIDEKKPQETISNVPAIATLVNIIDFNLLDGELLGITVEGINKILISDIIMEHDNLLTATYEPYHQWPSIPTKKHTQFLADKLKLFYSSMPEIGALYPKPNYQDMTWVCQRWLEILPIEVKHKQSLIHHHTATIAITFLLKLLQDQNLLNY